MYYLESAQESLNIRGENFRGSSRSFSLALLSFVVEIIISNARRRSVPNLSPNFIVRLVVKVTLDLYISI